MMTAASVVTLDARTEYILDRTYTPLSALKPATLFLSPPLAMPEPANVIIFGEAGVGKSSVVNMLLRRDAAQVSAGADGCTFESAHYPVQINDRTFNLHDTAGLGEVKTGKVDGAKAIKNLYRLVKKLSDADSGGINLLVLVTKAGRLTETIQKNYTLFHKGFCESKVPIVIIVTACEDVEPMQTWWTENKEAFSNAGLSFAGNACVCASRGRRTRLGTHVNDDLFEESKDIVERLIPRLCNQTGWKKPLSAWLKRVVRSFFGMWNQSKEPTDYPRLRKDLSSAFSDVEIDGIIDAMHDA